MGHAYPEGILTNADLEKIVETSDEWITSRTGIKQRHKAADNEYTSQFGTKAAKQALERAGLEARRHRHHHLRDDDARSDNAFDRRADPGADRCGRMPPEWMFLRRARDFCTA